MKEKILSEEPVSINPLVDEIVTSYNKMFRLGDPANYEPDPKDSFFSEAKRQGKSAQEVAYDMMLEKEGRALIYHPLFNYQPGDLSLVEKMLKHPFTISGFQAQPDEQVMPFSNFEDINISTETPVSVNKQRNPQERPLAGLRIADMT